MKRTTKNKQNSTASPILRVKNMKKGPKIVKSADDELKVRQNELEFHWKNQIALMYSCISSHVRNALNETINKHRDPWKKQTKMKTKKKNETEKENK